MLCWNHTNFGRLTRSRLRSSDRITRAILPLGLAQPAIEAYDNRRKLIVPSRWHGVLPSLYYGTAVLLGAALVGSTLTSHHRSIHLNTSRSVDTPTKIATAAQSPRETLGVVLYSNATGKSRREATC